MTPTLNGYFDDWRDSRYNPVATGHYVAESRVLDMRGIMYSLQITCDAILPQLQQKNPGLADQLKYEYANIISFIDRVEARDAKRSYKMSIPEIEVNWPKKPRLSLTSFSRSYDRWLPFLMRKFLKSPRSFPPTCRHKSNSHYAG